MKKPKKSQETPKETPQAAKAKQIYIELGSERSHEAVVAILGKKPGYKRVIEKWSSQFKWVEAAKAHDVEEVKKAAALLREKLQKELDAMNEYQARVSKGLFIKAAARLNELLDEATEPDRKLWGREAVALFKEAATIERLARGAATERTEVDHGLQEDTKSLIITAQFGTGIVEEEKA